MPAKGSDDLFKLIKSLSPAEKGYFKKFADRHSLSEKNNYLKLFEQIEAQEQYDEKKLLKESYINQLPRQKNYLQNLILKSLQVYSSEESKVVEIENSIQQVRILFKKGQYDLCRKLIVKTKREALEYEFFIEALKLAKFEDYLNKESGMDKKYDVEKLHYEERYRIMELEKNVAQIQELEQQVIMFARDEYPRNELLKNKLLENEPPRLSLKTKLVFYNTLSVFHNYMRNYSEQYNYSKKYIQLKKKEFEQFKGVYVFLPGFINYFFACYSNKKYKECNEVINELMAVPVNNIQEEEFRERIHLFLKTYLFLVTGQFERGLLFLKEHFEVAEQNKIFVNPRMDAEIMKNITLIYFANKQYKECLKWMNILLSGQTKDRAPFIYYQALLINILLHYELGNKETAGHLVISATRILKNNGKLKIFENTFLSFFKKYTVADSTDLLKKTITEIKNMEDKEDYHSHNSSYSYCLFWLESKVKNKSFSEIIKENAKKEAGKNYWS